MPRKPRKFKHLTFKTEGDSSLELEREGGGPTQLGIVVGNARATTWAWVKRKDARKLHAAIGKWLARGDRRA